MADDGSERSDTRQISDAMVRLYKELFGRGPTKVRSHWAGEDTIICSLEDTFTRAEQNMAANGEHQRLRDMRIYFQHASADDFRGAVEEITGRRVRAFVSGVDTHEDVAAEVFYLHPA